MLHTALLTVTLVAGTPPVDACSEPPRAAWAVTALHGAVSEDASLPLAAIQQAAQRRGAVAAHPPFGFYMGSFAHDLVVSTDRRTSPDGSRCGYLITVTVRLALLNRVVEVARDLRDEPCAYEAALRHYRKHAAADDDALSLYAALLRHELAGVWPKVEGLLGASGKPDKAAIRQAVEPVVNLVLDDVEQVRAKAIAAVDSGREVASLAAACSRF